MRRVEVKGVIVAVRGVVGFECGVVSIVVYVKYSCWVEEWVRDYVILARMSDDVLPN